MKCSECKYCTLPYCNHPRIYAASKKYELLKEKRINKQYAYIGQKMPKTSLRWCPYKMLYEKKEK